MTRTMYDGVSVGSIPGNATMVACYASGTYQNEAEARARFPHATIVTIAVRASDNVGHVLDCENGDATPDQCPGWARMRRAAGLATPCIYMNDGEWGAVQAAFRAAGEPQPLYWLAAWDGSATVPSGCVAHQYANTPGYDISAVADHWPGVDPGPTPPPVATRLHLDEDTRK